MLYGSFEVLKIRARDVIIRGKVDVRDRIRCERLYVYGCIKARSIDARNVHIIATAPSTIVDLYADVLRIRCMHRGRVSIGSLMARKAVIMNTYLHTIQSIDIIVLGDRCMIDHINCSVGLMIFKSPYVVFKDDIRDKVKKIVYCYNSP